MYSKIIQNKKTAHYYFLVLAGILLAFAQTSRAETPAQFASRFARFKFSYHEKVQEPDVFLSTHSGDCDDFATLADATLRESGYAPRLFAVRMKGLTHVVCYVPKAGAYLDYNNRAKSNPLVACDGSLNDIAGKVAKSFGRKWVAAYEFSYREKTKWLVNTVVFNNARTQPQPLLAIQ